MKTAELAEFLRKTPAAISTARHRGEAPASFGFRQGRTILYRRADIAAWLEKQGR